MMDEDILAKQSYGQVALRKLAPVDQNFRLYSAGWLGDDVRTAEVMEVKDAIFRPALKGPNKGKLAIEVKGTRRTVYVTVAEMRAQEVLEQPQV